MVNLEIKTAKELGVRSPGHSLGVDGPAARLHGILGVPVICAMPTPLGCTRNSGKLEGAARNEVNDAYSPQFKVLLPRMENNSADHVL